MQLGSGSMAVLPGGEDNHISLAFELHGRETPFAQRLRIIGKVPTLEVHRIRPGIINLDPVRELSILIRECPAIDGHNLADDEILFRTRRMIAGRENQPQTQRPGGGNDSSKQIPHKTPRPHVPRSATKPYYQKNHSYLKVSYVCLLLYLFLMALYYIKIRFFF